MCAGKDDSKRVCWYFGPHNKSLDNFWIHGVTKGLSSDTKIKYSVSEYEVKQNLEDMTWECDYSRPRSTVSHVLDGEAVER